MRQGLYILLSNPYYILIPYNVILIELDNIPIKKVP